MSIFQKKSIFSISITIISLLMISGCNKIINWGKQNFAQAPVYSEPFVREAQNYVKSALVYSQFSTVAMFDAIFLTDQMRMIYLDHHTKASSLTDQQKAIAKTRLLNENKYFISFYVIAYQKEHLYSSTKDLFTGSYQKQSDIFGNKDASWNISMIVNDRVYIPESVKIVDLPFEFREFFGRRLSQFHTTYLVRFAAQDQKGHTILEPLKKYKITLQFKSVMYESELIWRNMVYQKHG